jgi:hypothetical protein
MGTAVLLQFSIALLTGMVAATFVPHVRKSIPTPIESLLWIALVLVCLLGILSITDANARNLTTSVIWGTDRVVNTVVALILGGIAAWIMENRFPITTCLLAIAGVDTLALLIVRSARRARRWQPRLRLREWVEVPMPAPSMAVPAPAGVAAPAKPRVAAGTTVLGAAMLTTRAGVAGWISEVALPKGRAGSRAGLDSLRDLAGQLGYAARAWYVAAGEPMVSDIANRAGETARLGQVIDIQTHRRGQLRGEQDADRPPKSDRLAS